MGGAERAATLLANAWGAKGENVYIAATYSKGGDNVFYETKALKFNKLSSCIKAFILTIKIESCILTKRNLLLEQDPYV